MHIKSRAYAELVENPITEELTKKYHRYVYSRDYANYLFFKKRFADAEEYGQIAKQLFFDYKRYGLRFLKQPGGKNKLRGKITKYMDAEGRDQFPQLLKLNIK